MCVAPPSCLNRNLLKELARLPTNRLIPLQWGKAQKPANAANSQVYLNISQPEGWQRNNTSYESKSHHQHFQTQTKWEWDSKHKPSDDYNKKKSILLLFTSLLFMLPDLTQDWDNWPWIGDLAKSPLKTAGTTILNLPFNKHNSTEAGRELPVAFKVQVSTANPVHKHTFFPHVEKERPETTNRQARRAGRRKVGVVWGAEMSHPANTVWFGLSCIVPYWSNGNLWLQSYIQLL